MTTPKAELIEKIDKLIESPLVFSETSERAALTILRDAAEFIKASCVEMNGETSDGYHTFNELYDHRCLLYLAMCAENHKRQVYWVEDHFPGWDLVATNAGIYGQISYHVPAKFRAITSRFQKRDNKELERLFDGHTSKDVLERLEKWLTPDLPQPFKKEG